MAIKRDDQEQLNRIKKNIETSYMYMKENYMRFREYKRYVFKETINQQQRAMMQQLGRPVIEFNMGSAAINRLLGEFADHEPGIEVSPAEGVPVNQEVLDVVEGSIRHTLYEANKASFSIRLYKDMLGGGFSCGKVYTDYASPMSFNQQIFWDNVFDATMVGFDPLARLPHKGDGRFCFEIFPMNEEDFKREYPGLENLTLTYQRDLEGFNWSYKDIQEQKVILIADYYEKKKRKAKIVKLADGRVMTVKKYEEMAALWKEAETTGEIIEQMPVIVGEPRTTILETIVNYKLIEDRVLSVEYTDYNYLPHVFFDGNSEILTQGTSNNTYQFCTPYFYHARGAQDLMNFSGMAIANSIENLQQSQFIVMKEAIPQEQDYIEAITNPQKANTIVVNAYSENNPDKPIPTPIREVQHPPLPGDVGGTFNNSVGMIQAILGGMSSNPSNDQNYISGKAIVESISADNATAMPYVNGYLAGLAQMATIHCDLMPKYILGKRTIPIIKQDGEKVYQDVNKPGEPSLNYEERAIKVNVEAGVNFKVQQDKALQQIIGLMQASEGFAQFMNSEQGLKILVENLNCYSSDQLKDSVPKWVEKQEQMQQQQMQMQQQQMQQDPAFIRAQAELQKIQQQGEQNQVENQIEIAKLQIDKELADAKLKEAEAKIMESEAKISSAQVDTVLKMEETEVSRFNHTVDNATKMAELEYKEHQKQMDHHNLGLEHRKLDEARKPKSE